MNEAGTPEEIVFYYSLTGEADKVFMNIDFTGSFEDLFFGTPFRPLQGTTAGTHKVTWDGKDRFGNYVTDPKDGLVRIAIIAEKDGKRYSDSITVYELSSYFKPEIHLQATEFSPPVSIDIMLKHSRLFNSQETVNNDDPHAPPPFSYYIDPAPTDIETLKKDYDIEQYYLDLHDPDDGKVYDDYPENWRKRGLGDADGNLTTEETPTLYTHAATQTVTEDGIDRTLVFIQYWMFYPSSTSAIGKTGNAKKIDRYETGVVSSVGKNTITLNDASWKVNELIGSKIALFSSPHDYEVRIITENTERTITVERDWLSEKQLSSDGLYQYEIRSDDNTFHEGDWEMTMSIIELDTERETPWIRSLTASQHYTGQTLPTKAGRFKELYGDSLVEAGVDYVTTRAGRFPQLFIGGGSHATFFREGYFGTSNPFRCNNSWANIYENRSIPIDSTTPLKAETFNCGITPLDYYTVNWKGMWGKSMHAFYFLKGLSVLKPTIRSKLGSPKYREDVCDINLFINPLEWHNQYIRNGIPSSPDEQFFLRIAP